MSLPHEGALTRLSINSNCESSKFKVCEVVICYGVIYFTPSRKFVKLICYGVIYFTSIRKTKDFHQTFGWVFTGCFNLCCDLDTAFKGMCYHVRAGTPRSEDCVWEASCEFGHGGCTGFTNNDPAHTHWETRRSSGMHAERDEGEKRRYREGKERWRDTEKSLAETDNDFFKVILGRMLSHFSGVGGGGNNTKRKGREEEQRLGEGKRKRELDFELENFILQRPHN